MALLPWGSSGDTLTPADRTIGIGAGDAISSSLNRWLGRGRHMPFGMDEAQFREYVSRLRRRPGQQNAILAEMGITGTGRQPPPIAAFGAPGPGQTPPPAAGGLWPSRMGLGMGGQAGQTANPWETTVAGEPPPTPEPPPTTPTPISPPPITTNTPPEYQGQFGSQIGLLAGLSPGFRGVAGRLGTGTGETPPAAPPFETTIEPNTEFTTGDVLDSMRPEDRTTPPPTMPPERMEEIIRGAKDAEAGRSPPRTGPQPPGYLDRLLNNRAFLMGLSILGTQPGGNWGPNAVRSALEAEKARREQTEHERLTGRRSVMDRVWAEAFPNGQPNTQHPLLRDVPPEMLGTIFALGPDVGLPELQRYAFARGQQDLQLRQRERMLRLLAGETGGQPGGQPPPTGQPPPGQLSGPGGFTGGVGLSDGLGAGGAGPGREEVVAPGLTVADQAAGLYQPGGQPPPSTAAAPEPMVSWLGRQIPLSQARTIAQMADALGMRNEPLEQAITAAAAGQQAEVTRLGTGRGEQRAGEEARTERSRDIWGLFDQLERHVTGLGRSRLTDAASPALDTTAGAWTLGLTRRQAWNDRQEILAYLDNIVLLGRQGAGSQTGLSDRENDQIRRSLTAAREASTPEAFLRQIEIARGVLARNIPERRNYQPQLEGILNRVFPPPTGQSPGAGGQGAGPGQLRPLTPPPPGGQSTDRPTARDAGRIAYDSERGTYVMIDAQGRAIPLRHGQGGPFSLKDIRP